MDKTNQVLLKHMNDYQFIVQLQSSNRFKISLLNELEKKIWIDFNKTKFSTNLPKGEWIRLFRDINANKANLIKKQECNVALLLRNNIGVLNKT